jgi:eukaryotic-like serine/threonine-protein kinase
VIAMPRISHARLRNAPPPDRTRTGADAEAMRLTPRGAVLGSAPYMSPEQWCDPWSVGPATDIYALGCLAHETLTGRTPFEAADAGGYCDRHLRAEVPTLAGAFPPGVDRAIRRALEKSPEARHRSALDFAAEFRAALRAEPREQLRSAAQHWEDRERSPGFLWGREGLVEVARSVPQSAMSKLECLFVAESHRRAQRRAWLGRTLAAVAAAGTLAGVQYRSTMRSRLAESSARIAETERRAALALAEAKVTESELEQGRAALLHGESEALTHLSEAYRRDPAPTTAFMLSRSIAPRLAERARLSSTHGRTWWAAFSPDGSRIATSDDRAAQLWDAETYRLLSTLPHGAEVYQALYTPDGARLVTVAQTTLRVWDARSGAPVRELAASRAPGASDFFRAAISPDGRLVAAMDAGGSLASVWDLERATLLAEMKNRGAGVPRLAFSAHGYLATTGGDEVRLLEARGFAQVGTVPGPVRSLAFDAKGRLVTGSSTGEVALWEVPSGRRLRRLRAFGEEVSAVAFSRDGALVAAGSDDGLPPGGDRPARSASDPRDGDVRPVLP